MRSSWYTPHPKIEKPRPGQALVLGDCDENEIGYDERIRMHVVKGEEEGGVREECVIAEKSARGAGVTSGVLKLQRCQR